MLFYFDALMPSFSFIAFRRLFVKTAFFIQLIGSSHNAVAHSTVTVSNSLHYTDDVALFSVTRRLSLKDDPTQPVVDRPNQGGDFVYDPSVELDWSGDNALGAIRMSLAAGGYVFLDQSAYTHGLYEFQLAQTFTTGTIVSLHYNLVPDLFLGRNAIRQANGVETEHDEQLTNHYWSIHVDQPINRDITVRLLGRYGLRRYNAPFQHRDTQFWTLGPHLEWTINPDAALLIGYHYERGLANHQDALGDDISYVNHYASAELKLHVLDRLTAAFIIDYEKNDFTSHSPDDEHRGASENLFQGEIELLYDINPSTTAKLGWQHGRRKLTTENNSVSNNNVWLGLEYVF